MVKTESSETANEVNQMPPLMAKSLGKKNKNGTPPACRAAQVGCTKTWAVGETIGYKVDVMMPVCINCAEKLVNLGLYEWQVRETRKQESATFNAAPTRESPSRMRHDETIPSLLYDDLVGHINRLEERIDGLERENEKLKATLGIKTDDDYDPRPYSSVPDEQYPYLRLAE